MICAKVKELDMLWYVLFGKSTLLLPLSLMMKGGQAIGSLLFHGYILFSLTGRFALLSSTRAVHAFMHVWELHKLFHRI